MQPGTIAVCFDNIRNYEGEREMGQVWEKNKRVATLAYLKRNPSQGTLVVWRTEGFVPMACTLAGKDWPIAD